MQEKLPHKVLVILGDIVLLQALIAHRWQHSLQQYSLSVTAESVPWLSAQLISHRWLSSLSRMRSI